MLCLIVLVTLACPPPAVQAQHVAAYRFLATETVYTPLTDGIQVLGPDTDDALSELVFIGFPFTYAGQTYYLLQVSSNGFIRLGADGSNAGFDNDLSSTSVGPLLAPLWDDLSVGSDGVVHYQLSGQAPGRVLTIEFVNMRWDLFNDAADAHFQVQLYESSSEIAFIYGALGNPNATSGGASIGLSYSTEDSTYFLSVTPAGPVVLSSTLAKNDLAETTFLPPGTTYRFMPPLEKDLEARSMDTPPPSRFPKQAFIPRVKFRNTSLTDFDSVEVKYEVLRKSIAVYRSIRTLTDFASGEIEQVAFEPVDLPAGHYTIRTTNLLQGDQYAMNDTLSGGLIVNWGIQGEMIIPRRGHTATVLPDGRVFVVGGYDSEALAEAEIFDPATGTWHRAASMKTARLDHTATLLNDGRVLVAGGRNSDSLRTAELYNPATDTWTAARLMANTRYSHTASLLPDGRVLVVGGFGETVYHSPTEKQRSEIYNPASDTWTMGPELPNGRAAHAAVTLNDGRILIAGGKGDSPTECYLYDPINELWAPAGNLQVRRTFGKAILLSNGKVLMTGGYASDIGLPAENSVEIYDARINHWRAVTPMQARRQAHTISLLSDGKVLVTGGTARTGAFPNQAFARSEVFDPATGAWTFAGDLEEARHTHTASILPDGSVLVVGGIGAESNSYRSSAERYDYPAVLASTPVEFRPALPDAFVLQPNYPNPFNPATTIAYTLTRPAEVTLAVFDLLGRRVRTLVEARQAAGSYEVRFDGSGLPSGLYLYRLQAGHQVRTRKMMLVK